MAVSKKTYIWIFVIIALIAVVAIVYYFFFKDDVPTPTEPVPVGSPTPAWVAESFPLNVGMYGPKIKALQASLKIADDGKFGNQTKGAILAKGYAVPLSESDYNKILGLFNPGNVAYAVRDGVKVWKREVVNAIDTLILYKTAQKDEYIGSKVGESGSVFLIVGNKEVTKTDVYFK